MTDTTLRLERECCTRCGGSGHYSYCQMYGTTCFKCHGKGQVLTKRGRVAMDYLVALRSKRADELQVGDYILADYSRKLSKIVEIKPCTMNARNFINGVEQPRRTDLLNIITERLNWGGIAPETMVQIGMTKEQQLATLQEAIAYQNTLTKQGKPRKGS